MSETRVVHVKDQVIGAVYIGRANKRYGLKASPFANPYAIDRRAGMTRAKAIKLYAYDLEQGDKRHLLAELPALRGKPLACWCRHDGRIRDSDTVCHGDVLIDLLNRHSDDELRAKGRTA